MHPRGWPPQAAYDKTTNTWLKGGDQFLPENSGETEAQAKRFFSTKKGIWLSVDEMFRHAIEMDVSLDDYHIYPQNKREKFLLVR